MRRLIAVGVVLWVCFVTCGAESVNYSIPILTVRANGDEVILGSGTMNRCPFSFVRTTNSTPVKVSITEDIPSGVGNQMRASVWLAATTAALSMNQDLAGIQISFETSGNVDGPSAGGMFCLAVMSAMEHRQLPDDFAMTGTIMADGTIGPVGGIAEKLRAASKAGIKRVCIPTFTRMDEGSTDLMKLGKELKLEMHQVATIGEAYQILHHLPIRQRPHLNPYDVCQLPPSVEEALKFCFDIFRKELPQDPSKWNEATVSSLKEYRAGLFGASVMDLIGATEKYYCDSHRVDAHALVGYPGLEREIPTNSVSIVDRILENFPDREQYVKSLKELHGDLKELERVSEVDELEIVEVEGVEAKPNDPSVAGKSLDWFADCVKSPCGGQFSSLTGFLLAKLDFSSSRCDNITDVIDSVEDWDTLDAEQLNLIRSCLLEKMNALTLKMSLVEGGENRTRFDMVYEGINDSIPYIRPNQRVEQVEDVLWRTIIAMNSDFKENGIEGCCVEEYLALFDIALKAHNKKGSVLDAIFMEIHALSTACAVMQCRDTDFAEGGPYYSSVVSTARENALLNIFECRELGIPCAMPIIIFQMAESMRDAHLSDIDAQSNRSAVFAEYLQASLSAKALSLCFKGQKPELNEKGYCSRSMTFDNRNFGITIRYLGVDGEPILRDGFSGYRKFEENGLDCTAWLDLSGKPVRFSNSNECFTVAYDDRGRDIRKTYCNDSWQPKPREDGVLFVTFGYDADGNQTDWDFFGVTSNRVFCADGMASIRKRFNKRGQEVWRRFLGAEDEPVVHKEGYAGFDVVYDICGKQRRFTYVDCKGAPVMTTLGYAMEERQYNAQNLEIERAWYDAQGNLVCVNGVAKRRAEYDKNGNVKIVAYFDSADHLTRCTENYAIVQWSYNQVGEEETCGYYGPDCKPTLHKDGFSAWKTVFDASGRNVGRVYYDLNGKEISIKSNVQ